MPAIANKSPARWCSRYAIKQLVNKVLLLTLMVLKGKGNVFTSRLNL